MLYRNFLCACLGILLLAAAAVSARDLAPAEPQRVGLAPDRLERLTARMNRAVDDGVMVGGLGMIARRGRVAYEETYGLADREAAVPMSPDTIFRIYSMTKPITGVALMILYEEGEFFLNDPVGWYLPELADLKVAVATADGGQNGATPAAQTGSGAGATANLVDSADAGPGPTREPIRQPTIRDLLTHTAGFTYGVFGDTAVDQRYRQAELITSQIALPEFVARLGRIPLQYDPGTRWHYSVSVDVQGALVQAVSGMTLGEFMQSRIFGPLGMVDTSFVVPQAKWARVAQMYSPAGTPDSDAFDAFMTENTATELEVADDQWNEGYRVGAKFESGGGGLVSTAADYLRFSQMLLNGGELDGVRILSPKTVQLMTADHTGHLVRGMDSPGYGFGLGVAVALDPGAIGELSSAGEYNWGGAAGTRFWIDPQEELIGVFMVQSIPHRTRLGSEFKNLVYQAVVD